jgi:hypothetical protein
MEEAQLGPRVDPATHFSEVGDGWTRIGETVWPEALGRLRLS